MPDEQNFILKDKNASSKEKHTEKSELEEEPKNIDKEKSEEPGSKDQKPKENFVLPEMNFATFIFSLNSSALVQLGKIENPATGEKEENLPLAKQTIDILSMLEEKTKGNLTKDEETLLKNILFELRMIYVKEMDKNK